MIRICGGFIDGDSGTNVLGRAFFPPNGGNANALAANGDIVLDSGNTWDDTLLKAVVLHELGHSLGLNHETNTIAVMNPTIGNPPLTTLQTDDINGIRAVYGAKNLGNPPPPAGTTADIILRHGTNGQYYIYDIGNSSVLAAYQLGQVGTDWTVPGVGGFFGNDTTDMLLRNSNTGAFYVYDVQNNNITNSASLGAVGPDWQVIGFGNFSSFGETDIMMRRSTDGAIVVYDIRNNQIIGTNVIGTVGLNWQFSGIGNFSSRGTSDMILRDSNTGGLEVYDINSNQITGAAFLGTVGLEWQFAGVGPIHAASASDLVLRNVNTGAFQVYDIAFNSLIGSASLGSVGLDWQVGGIAMDHPTASSGSMGGSSQAAQLVQAMADFGGGSGAVENSSAVVLAGDTSQQPFLTPPAHA
jgi:matrixin